MKKIIIINFLVFIALFIIAEAFSYCYLRKKYNIKPFHYQLVKNPKNEKYDLLRPVVYKNNLNSPVLLFGCSYIWGLGLEENEIFSYKLANYTNRTVVNRAYIGESPAFMYKQFSDEDTVSDMKQKLGNKNPEVIIFNFLSGHITRPYQYRHYLKQYFTDRYTIDKNNNLKEYQPPDWACFFHTFYTVILYERIKEKIDWANHEKLIATNTKLLSESYRLAKLAFPNSKFVIMNYPCCIGDIGSSEMFLGAVVEPLKEAGINDIITIDIPKIFPEIYNKEYWLEDDTCHPSSLAWEKLTPIIAEELNLNKN